jgi:hypothetical protein
VDPVYCRRDLEDRHRAEISQSEVAIMVSRKRLRKTARVAKVVGLSLFYLALTAALAYTVLSSAQAGAL